MSASGTSQLLGKLLLRNKRNSRLWAALMALFVGNTLLLLSVMIWWNFRELLYGGNQNESIGSTYLIVAKKVTNNNMGDPKATVFSIDEIAATNQAPEVQAVGAITSNHFPVYAMMGGNLGFATDLPLESVPDSFIDKLPADWKWEPGSNDLPIMMSSQLLDIYNYVFAPSQGLPQLSESSVKSLALQLKAGPADGGETFLAHVVGFSDRISSVMAPQSFIDYGNKRYGKPGTAAPPSQLILKVKDPSNKQFADYITQHGLTTNAQNLRWSRMRAVAEGISAATGVLALLLMGIGILVFILFIELTIARAQQSINLLKEIGYSPHYLSGFMIRRFLPLIFFTVVCSAGAATGAQYFASVMAVAQGLALPAFPGLPVWLALAVSIGTLVLLVIRSIRASIR